MVKILCCLLLRGKYQVLYCSNCFGLGKGFYKTLLYFTCVFPYTEDKQKRYHWTSQLLTVCDYLSRDEARAVLRLDVTDPPQIVLASINLFSALLGCCECVSVCVYVCVCVCMYMYVFVSVCVHSAYITILYFHYSPA